MEDQDEITISLSTYIDVKELLLSASKHLGRSINFMEEHGPAKNEVLGAAMDISEIIYKLYPKISHQ